MNERTKALLDEVQAPKHASRESVEAAALAILPMLARCNQQAAEILSLAQAAEMVEGDEQIRGRMEAYVQKARAMQRLCGNIEKNLRDLVTAQRGLRSRHEDTQAFIASREAR